MLMNDLTYLYASNVIYWLVSIMCVAAYGSINLSSYLSVGISLVYLQ